MDWEQVLGLLVNERLSLILQCVLGAQKATPILDCIKSNVASRARGFCSSVFMRLHPECCIQLQSSQHRSAGPEAIKMIRDGITLLWGRVTLSQAETARAFSLKRKVQGDINAAFPLTGSYKKDGDGFLVSLVEIRKSNSSKLKERKFWLELRKKSFTVRMVKHWKRLPKVEVDTTSLGVSKVKMDRFWATWSSGRCLCLLQGD